MQEQRRPNAAASRGPPTSTHVEPPTPLASLSSFIHCLRPAPGGEFGGQRALSSCRPPKWNLWTRSSAQVNSLFQEITSSSPNFRTSENLMNCFLYFSHL